MHIPTQTVKHLHFVGIGGIGMSGIAEVLHNIGYQVKGSDIAENVNISRLQTLGIQITIGHQAENIKDAQVVVVSSAVSPENPEVLAAKTLGIPVIQRAEMLAELMRLKLSVAISGTHGKTTTTSLVAALLDTADMDPTVVNGGIINAYNTNARLGTGEWIVVEADESDGSFVKLPSTLAIITNIDPEHMDFYGNFENLKNSFLKFIENTPFYGLGILCLDHPEVQSLIPLISNRRILTYGFDEKANVRATNLRMSAEYSTFDVDIQPLHHHSFLVQKEIKNGGITALPRRLKDIKLPMLGKHNIQNALSVIAVAQELGIDDETVRTAFKNFKGVKRRFTKVGVSGGVTIIDDYAHHPVEIQTVIEAAKQSTDGKIIAVVQPHRYSRLNDLFQEFSLCFKECDSVVVAPIYSAGEEPIPNISSKNLAEAIRNQGINQVFEIEDAKELPYIIRRIAQENDTVLCLGAGSITYWAAALPAQLDQLWDQPISHQQENLG